MKKALVVIASLVMLFGMAACSDSNGTGGQSDGATSTAQDVAVSLEPMEISFMSWGVANSIFDSEPDRMRDFIEKKFNIKISVLDADWDDMEQKTNTWAAAGTLPDVIGGQDLGGTPKYRQWIDDGVVRALPGDLSKYPYVEKYVRQPDADFYAIDGKNYFLPRQTYKEAAWSCLGGGMYNGANVVGLSV